MAAERGGEERDHIQPALLPADFIRQLPLVPFLQDDRLAFVLFHDSSDEFQRPVQV